MSQNLERIVAGHTRADSCTVVVHGERQPECVDRKDYRAACLIFELIERGLRVERQKPLPLVYRGITLDCAYRMDIVVEDEVIVEVKAVQKLDAFGLQLQREMAFERWLETISQ